MKPLIETAVIFFIFLLIAGFIFMLSTISPKVNGIVTAASSDIPLKNIAVCWERLGSESVIGKGCTLTDDFGNYNIPGMYKFLSKPVFKLKIYYNKEVVPDDTKEPFNFAETPQNKEYSTETFSVSFPIGIPTFFPLSVDMGLYQNK